MGWLKLAGSDGVGLAWAGGADEAGWRGWLTIADRPVGGSVGIETGGIATGVTPTAGRGCWRGRSSVAIPSRPFSAPPPPSD